MNSDRNPSKSADETKSTPAIEIVDQSKTLDAGQIKHLETLLERAATLHKEIDSEQAKLAIKIVWQGCHLFVVEEALGAIEDKKVRLRVFKELLGKYGIANSTARQRILLVKRMKQKRALSGRIFLNAEEDDKISPEVLKLLDKACGNKLAVDLQREYGIRQPLKDREKDTKTTKALSKQIEEMGKRVVKTLGEIGTLVEETSVDQAAKDKLIKLSNDLAKAYIHFQRATMEHVPKVSTVDPDALAAINPPAELVTV